VQRHCSAACLSIPTDLGCLLPQLPPWVLLRGRVLLPLVLPLLVLSWPLGCSRPQVKGRCCS
jgi:hypothetical protein